MVIRLSLLEVQIYAHIYITRSHSISQAIHAIVSICIETASQALNPVTCQHNKW